MNDPKPKTYHYVVDGTDATGQKWQVTGYVDTFPGGVFRKVPEVAEAEMFVQLTQGKAVFGHPGLMCKGPYRVRKFVIEELKDETR